MALLDKLFSSLSTKSTPTSKRVVGIDVGSSSMKVVEVQERNSVLTLTTYGEIQLAPYDGKHVGETVLLDAKKEQQALVDVLRESAVKAKQAVFAMPLSSSFVTIMTLKADQKEDITPRVRIEARKYIPVQLSEVTLDWAEVETEGSVSKTARDVLLAAIQNDSLARFKELMKFVNLVNPPTEIECFSTIRGLYDSKLVDMAVIDFGATSTKLYIAKQGLLQRMHRVRAGGSHVTTKLAQAQELDFQDAEVLKREITKEDGAYADASRAMRSTYERPLQEFRQVIEEYEARAGNDIKRVYLTGGGALFPSLVALAKDTLSRDVQLASPFNKVAYPAFMEDTMDELGPTFATALGAALRFFE